MATSTTTPSALERFDALLQEATDTEKEQLAARLGTSKRQHLLHRPSEFYHHRSQTIRPCFAIETTRPEDKVDVRAEKMEGTNMFKYTESFIIDTCAIGHADERPELEICKFIQVDVRRSKYTEKITIVVVSHLIGDLVDEKFKTCVRFPVNESVVIEGAGQEGSQYNSRLCKFQKVKIFVPDTAYFALLPKDINTLNIREVNNPLLVFDVDGCKGGIEIKESTLGAFICDDVHGVVKVENTVFISEATFITNTLLASFLNVHVCGTIEVMSLLEEKDDPMVIFIEVFVGNHLEVTNVGKTKIQDCRVKGQLRLRTRNVGGSHLIVNDMKWNMEKKPSGVGFDMKHVVMNRVRCSNAAVDVCMADVQIKDIETADGSGSLSVRTKGEAHLIGNMHGTIFEVKAGVIVDESVSGPTIEKTMKKDKDGVIVELMGEKKEEE